MCQTLVGLCGAGCGDQSELAEGFGRRAQKRRRAGDSLRIALSFREGYVAGGDGWCWIRLVCLHLKEYDEYDFPHDLEMDPFFLHIWISQSNITVWNIHQLIVHY